MIEVFTWLFIEYRIQNQAVQTRVLFETAGHCEQVLRIDALYDVFYDQYEDVAMRCVKTDHISKSLRPKLRPEGVGK